MAEGLEDQTDLHRRVRLATLNRWQTMAAVRAALDLSGADSRVCSDLVDDREPAVERRVLSLR